MEFGQMLGVTAMVAGSIGKVGSTYSVDIRTIDVQSGQILHSLWRDYRGEIDGLLGIMPGIAEELVSAAVIAEAPPPEAPTPASLTIISQPPGAQVMLLDLVQRRAYDFTTGELPEAITNYSEELPRRLKVIAGTSDYMRGTIEEALARLPEEFALSQNYPNPFNPSTTIEYALPLPARVSLRVYNLLGREIAVLVNDWQDMGYYEIVWQGRDRAGRSMASGVYFAILQADDKILTRKMVLLR